MMRSLYCWPHITVSLLNRSTPSSAAHHVYACDPMKRGGQAAGDLEYDPMGSINVEKQTSGVVRVELQAGSEVLMTGRGQEDAEEGSPLRPGLPQDDDDNDDYGSGRLRYSSRRSDIDDGMKSCSSAVVFTGYMVSTASAKAKFRSMSLHKERFAVSLDAYSEQCFPSFADRLMLPIPSIASDMGFARSGRPLLVRRSPWVKGPITPSRTCPGDCQAATALAL